MIYLIQRFLRTNAQMQSVVILENANMILCLKSIIVIAILEDLDKIAPLRMRQSLK